MEKKPAKLIDRDRTIYSDEVYVYLASEVDEVLKRQASAARAGMNAATAVSSGQLQEAHRLRTESSPEALESERQANAILTERVADLEQACKENARYSTEMREEFERRGARIIELQKALADSQCPYPIGNDNPVAACIAAGKCGCENKFLMVRESQ